MTGPEVESPKKHPPEEAGEEPVVIAVPTPRTDKVRGGIQETGREVTIEMVRRELVGWALRKRYARNSGEAEELAQVGATALSAKKEWASIEFHFSYAVKAIYRHISKQRQLGSTHSVVDDAQSRDQLPWHGMFAVETKELLSLLAQRIEERANEVLKDKALQIFIEYAVEGYGSHEQVAVKLALNKGHHIRRTYQRAVQSVLGIKCTSLQNRQHSISEIKQLCEQLGWAPSDINPRKLFAKVRGDAGSD